MPNWMDKPQEKDFERASKIVKKEKGGKKPKKKLKSKDYGLVMHIWKNMQKSKNKPEGKKKKKKAEYFAELLSFANFLDERGLFSYADAVDTVVSEIISKAGELDE